MSMFRIIPRNIRGSAIRRPERHWSYRYRSTSANSPETAHNVLSVSPLAPIGVKAAIESSKNPTIVPRPKIFDEFSLKDRVGIVSGGNRGLGLEMALALCETGARTIYCIDLPTEPSDEWQNTREYVKRMDHGSRLEYLSMDVTDQHTMWDKIKGIGDKEGRMDVCIAAAGIAHDPSECLNMPASQFQKVLDVNVNGVLFTAQAAGQQMVRFGNPGSIIMIASVAGSRALRGAGSDIVGYNTSKSAVLQMARSMACELAPRRIRVNTISPGYMQSPMTAPLLEVPEVSEELSTVNPMGRIGRPDELRGVVAWLASDASSYCTGSNIAVSGGHHAW